MKNNIISKKETRIMKPLWQVLISSFAGILTALILSLILTAALINFEDPEKYMSIIAVAVLLFGAFSSGISARIAASDGTNIISLLSGTVYGMIALLIGLIFGAGDFSVITFILCFLCVPVSILGKIVFSPKKANTYLSRSNKKSPTAMARKKLGNRI